jgi:hypothetical protein
MSLVTRIPFPVVDHGSEKFIPESSTQCNGGMFLSDMCSLAQSSNPSFPRRRESSGFAFVRCLTPLDSRLRGNDDASATAVSSSAIQKTWE